MKATKTEARVKEISITEGAVNAVLCRIRKKAKSVPRLV